MACSRPGSGAAARCCGRRTVSRSRASRPFATSSSTMAAAALAASDREIEIARADTGRHVRPHGRQGHPLLARVLGVVRVDGVKGHVAGCRMDVLGQAQAIRTCQDSAQVEQRGDGPCLRLRLTPRYPGAPPVRPIGGGESGRARARLSMTTPPASSAGWWRATEHEALPDG